MAGTASVTSSSSSSTILFEWYSDSDSDPGPTPREHPDNSALKPDALGISTGPEADAVLSRSHARWHDAARAAEAAAPGDFPPGAFNLEGLLARVPALPYSIPADQDWLTGYSTWENLHKTCSLREKTEKHHSLVLCAPMILRVSVSASDDFQTWPGTDNNGVSLLVLAQSYVLNASFAEKLTLPLKRIPATCVAWTCYSGADTRSDIRSARGV